MRIKALIVRILRQFRRDKRTMALLILAPILVLSLLYLVFGDEDYTPRIGLVDIPQAMTERVDTSDAEVTVYENEEDALEDLEMQELDGYVTVDANEPSVTLEGSDPTINSAVLRWMQDTFSPLSSQEDNQITATFLHGSEDMRHFDYFGPVLLGFFVFFFVFLISGVFFPERTDPRHPGTPAFQPLEEMGDRHRVRRRLRPVHGPAVDHHFCLYDLCPGHDDGRKFLLRPAHHALLSFTALTLGILLSSFAQNELQMIQFIPIVVVPQLFFSGLFTLETISDYVSWIGTAHALILCCTGTGGGCDGKRVRVRAYRCEPAGVTGFFHRVYCTQHPCPASAQESLSLFIWTFKGNLRPRTKRGRFFFLLPINRTRFS
ncbi:MAG: ABC transporter permease [Alkalibacterium sp.]|nr:ABC transporter permease [Alkalibacterium sp.]